MIATVKTLLMGSFWSCTRKCHIRKRGYVSGIVPNTSASRIHNIRRKCVGAFVVSINDIAVFTAAAIVTALQAVAASDERTFKIVFAPVPVADRHLNQPLHLSVDQLRTISTLRSSSSSSYEFDLADDDDHVQLLRRSLNTTTHGTTEEQGLGSFTR
jgi:hypothetical protein